MKLGLATRVLVLMVFVAATSAEVGSQTVEAPQNPLPVVAALDWSAGPKRTSVPEWARNGSIRFARWDGGRIEATKGILSGWPDFWPPNPNVLYATDHWYDPSTIRLLREAGINMIWVTFSNGFSNETEKLHQEQAARYIRECHRQGIHVMAYESSSNLFWQDMYKNVPASRNWVLKDKNGKPTPYGSAAYEKIGYVTRYVADPGNPEWQTYLRARIKLALDAGADGVMYDNNVDDDIGLLMNVYQMIYRYGASLKKDFLFMGNFHQETYVLNRVTNCMTTEDGAEPGIYTSEHVNGFDYPQYLLAIGRGYLVDNVGLLKLLASLSEGWKPNLVEDGHLEFGAREERPMSSARRQLAMAEAMAYGAADEMFVEDAVATGLWNRDAQAVAAWREVAKYNRFFANHEEYYRGWRTTAPLAIVLDDSSRGVELLNGLAARHVLFDVLYGRDLSASELARYRTVALLTAETISDRALSALERYVTQGGRLVVAVNAAFRDERGRERPKPSFFGRNIGNGYCDYLEHLPSIDELANILKRLAGGNLPEVNAPPDVLYNLAEQPSQHRVILHLLNYSTKLIRNVGIRMTGTYRTATLLTPDFPNPTALTISRPSAHSIHLSVPRLKIYAVVVLTE